MDIPGDETEIFCDNLLNAVIVDVMAPYVTGESVSMAFAMFDKQVCLFSIMK